MSMKTEERIKALDVALENEQRERDFYLQHKEKTVNPLGKSMFDALAADEDEHYQRIGKLHEKLASEGKWPETIPLTVKGTEVKSVLKNVLDSNEKLPPADKDDLEAVKIAIDFETKGVNFYEKLRDGADDKQEREFYAMLASIEREHLLSLQNILGYFQDPEGWNLTMEKPHLDGG